MSDNSYELVKYQAKWGENYILVIYDNTYNTLNINIWNNYYTINYHIELTRNTRKLPEFKRFNNDIRARIGTGIHICTQTPGCNLPLYIAQEDRPNPWWKQRRKVSVS